tara:strand:+ start:449 stop:994 length:546 start_codon:yes stop_codon:yes gene_type:complete
MANSLQDQLLKAGLIDSKKVKKVKQEKRKQAKQLPKGHQQEDETKRAARQAQAVKSQRDRKMNLNREKENEKKAIQAQIKQLIEVNRIERKDGETAYQFVDAKKIKKLYITKELQEQLSKGRIAVVKLGDQFELVPTPVAKKIAQRDDSIVLVLHVGEVEIAGESETDPYSNYQIPDDLMW